MCVKLRPLTAVLAARAAIELNERPADVPYYLQALREWVLTQKHLRSRTTDQFLIVFLRAGKFSLEQAKHRLENYYVHRATMPEIFRDRKLSDPKIYAINKAGCLLYLPEPVAPDGPRVIMIRPSRFDMSVHTIPDVFKVGSMATDILLYEDDNAIVAGYIVIMDLANIPKSVYLQFDPNFAKKITIMINKISPTRLKGFHFLNVPPVFEKLFNMVKSVINVKLRNRFYVHGNNFDSLYEHIPRHILPQEYGGDCDTSAMQTFWWNKFTQHQHFLQEEETYGLIKETEKCCKQRNQLSENECTFGVDGSFRKLNVD